MNNLDDINNNYDVVVIGGGPAGLAAAISADTEGSNVLLIEREGRLGGILKQCIHDGFGLVRFKEKLSGPEYVERFIDDFMKRSIDFKLLTFVTSIEKKDDVFHISAVNREGVVSFIAKSLVLANGCRERTAKQVFIHGTRPAGVLTAGTCQHLVNLSGLMPTKKCVILGSGDIGLIMARRLTLEGAQVLGVYEVKSKPSGLTRNLIQCLDDYEIPLHLSHTVTRVFGNQRLESVEIMAVNEDMVPIEGTEEIIQCDALILSVGLIPENEIAESLGVTLSPRTNGPLVDSDMMTDVDGIFSCGNALHVNDLVDYVSESGELAGYSAAHYNPSSTKVAAASINLSDSIHYVVPQSIVIPNSAAQDTAPLDSETILYFRSRDILRGIKLIIEVDGEKIFHRNYVCIKPPEMERIAVNFSNLSIDEDSKINMYLQEQRKEKVNP